MAEYKREVGTAVTLGVVVAAFAAILAISEAPSNTSTSSSSTNSPASSSSPVYQVMDSNLTLRGQAATVVCNFLGQWLWTRPCPSAGNASLAHVQLVKNGDAYYYALNNQSALSSPCSVLGVKCASYPYNVWFTNSSVFCVSYATPQGNVCPSLPHTKETAAVPIPSAAVTNPSNGLRLTLNLSTISLGAVNVTVSEFNTLDYAINVTNAGNFPPPTAGESVFEWIGTGCTHLPIAYVVLQGNYWKNNYTQGTALKIAPQGRVRINEDRASVVSVAAHTVVNLI